MRSAVSTRRTAAAFIARRTFLRAEMRHCGGRRFTTATAEEKPTKSGEQRAADGGEAGSSNLAGKPLKTTLNPRHRTIAEGGIPPLQYEFEREKWAQAERFGQYGLKSGVDIRTLWPTIEEIEEIQTLRMSRTAKEAVQLAQKQAEIAKRLHQKKLDTIERNWAAYPKKMAEFEQREIQVKEEKETKEHELEVQIRDVQDYFGYWVDPKDPRFALMLREREVMAKEAERKARKAAKKQKVITAADKVSGALDQKKTEGKAEGEKSGETRKEKRKRQKAEAKKEEKGAKKEEKEAKKEEKGAEEQKQQSQIAAPPAPADE